MSVCEVLQAILGYKIGGCAGKAVIFLSLANLRLCSCDRWTYISTSRQLR
jgi:hypothetical protein